MENNKIDFANIVTKIREKIALDSNENSAPYIPDIIEFCNSKKYLDLPGKKILLYPMQTIILKCFYRGQPGNENVALTPEELQLMHDNKMQSVIDKYNSGHLFNELVLVLGRRGGKDFLVSMIALYEAMKLLEIPGGCPFKYYGIDSSNPIFILTIATAADQAFLLFSEIQKKMQTSDYFRTKIGHMGSDRIWLLTPEDRKNNKELIDAGLANAVTKGSVVIMSGHSNSDSLLGKGYAALLFDEVASFKTTGAYSGARMYEALGPGTLAFNKLIGHDENGNEIRRSDAKIVSISSPRSEEGILYSLYNEAKEVDERLAFKLPTWKVNLRITEELCRKTNKFMSPEAFQMEFGAEFSGTAGEKFIPNHYIDAAIDLGRELGLEQKITGMPGMAYFAHLDPSSTSHNYALVLLHTEERILIREKEGVRTKEKIKLFIVDHIKMWTPHSGSAINVNEVDQYIIDLARRFRFAMVSYDSWNSIASVQKLRAKGIPTKITPFRKQYKMAIYDHLEHLLVNRTLALPYKGSQAQTLEMELKCLKRIYSPAGFKIKPDPDAAVNTDDFCDALSGACAVAMENIYGGYAKSASVYMPQVRDEKRWNIGRASWENQQWGFLNKKFGK